MNKNDPSEIMDSKGWMLCVNPPWEIFKWSSLDRSDLV